MTAEARVRALAASLDVTVRAERGGWFEVLLEAPPGFLFDTGAHEMVVSGNPGEPAGAVWRQAFVALSDAQVEPCDDPDCEWCGRGPGQA